MAKILKSASTPARTNGRTTQAVWLNMPELLPYAWDAQLRVHS